MSDLEFENELKRILLSGNLEIYEFSDLCSSLANLLTLPHWVDTFIMDYLLQLVLNSTEEVELSQKALLWLNKITEANHIHNICQTWLDTRNPKLENLIINKNWVVFSPNRLRVYTALKTNQLTLLDSWYSYSTTLNEASRDSDLQIAKRAELVLSQLLGQVLPHYYSFSSLQRLVANKELPPEINQLLLSLLDNDWEAMTEVEARFIPLLVEATENRDEEISYTARMSLEHLARPEAQQLLCRIIIEQSYPVAEAAAVSAGYQPTEPYQRALFFFLTEQWEQYEAIDFDQRMLKVAYQTADTELRERLSERIRSSGRSAYLNVLVEANREASGAIALLERNRNEDTQLLLEVLSEAKEWTRLWTLALQMPVEWSVRTVKILITNSWQPKRIEERETFLKLKKIIGPHLTSLADSVEGSVANQELSVWFELPLAQFHLSQLNELESWLEDQTLEPWLEWQLRYIQVVLQHRFRNDIEIDENISWPVRDYDIEIEGP
jgi:hypothetical protein